MASTWSRQWTYLTLGAVLALGCPVGFLCVQAGLNGAIPTFAWIGSELRSQSINYIYLTASTMLVFTTLGWLLGRREDHLLVGSLTDPLTGLWNRRHLNMRLNEELARATRFGTPLTLLLIDVDHLKQINDTSGHQAGDEAIVCVANAIAKSFRKTDIAARCGGDEFAILAPCTRGRDALAMASRMRAVLEEAEVHGERISVSIGVAALRDAPSMDVNALYQTADHALYRAKEQGRNQVVRVPYMNHVTSLYRMSMQEPQSVPVRSLVA